MCDGEHFPRKGGCPRNTNSKCEIIPKRKSKVRRVKAWAEVIIGQGTNRWIKADNMVSGGNKVSCTILIDEKYLKEAA